MKTLICSLMLALCAATAFAADVSGKWPGTFTPEGQEGQPALVVLKQTGDTVTGTGGPNEDQQWPIANGKIEGDKVTFDLNAPNNLVLKMTLLLDGEKLKGDATLSRDGQTMKAKLDLARAK